MDTLLYRFRTAERLLGTEGRDGTPGELENLEIYFSPPEQLNDPLEGYREIYWEGDIIAWKGFLKHYILILTIKAWEVSAKLSGRDIESRLTMNCSPNNLSERQLKAFIEMVKTMDADPIFSQYIEGFASNRLYKPELLHYLIGLHDRILLIVLTVNLDKKLTNLKPDSYPFDPTVDVDYHLDKIQRLKIKRKPGSHYSSYKNVPTTISAYEIKTAHLLDPNKKELFQLLQAFPATFLSKIEELLYPDWYIACFMAECDNSAIWGSYGDNHKGICLIYRAEGSEPALTLGINKPILPTKDKIIYNYEQMNLKEVNYGKDHLEVDFFRSITNLDIGLLVHYWYTGDQGELSSSADWLAGDSGDKFDKHWVDFFSSLTSKLDHWNAEKEYRLILNSQLDLRKKELRLLKYKLSSLEGLIFGIKTPTEHKLKAINIIKMHCQREKRDKFDFYQAYYDPSSKTIKHAALPFNIHEE